MTRQAHVAAGILALVAALAAAPAAAASESAPPASATDTGADIVLRNGRVSLVLSKSRLVLTSISHTAGGRTVELGNGRDTLYFDANGGPVVPPAESSGPRPRGGYVHPLAGGMCRIVQAGPRAAEVAIDGNPSAWFPFRTRLHLVLPQGESGFYVYAVYEHGPGMPAAELGQTRFVVRSVPGTDLFTHHVVDEQRRGPFPAARAVEVIQDATERLQDGTIYTKYDNAVFLADHHVHGMSGRGLGLWMIFPTNEFVGGGPLKQELTVHRENVLLGMLMGSHYGSGGLRLADDEPWLKMYGPLFVYVNGGQSADVLWTDAKCRAAAETAAWPFAWLNDAAHAPHRGSVLGRVSMTDGSSAAGAWAILAPPGDDWTRSSKGYHFWTRVDREGRFVISGVRPGRYALHLSGADQFDDFTRADVEVSPDKVTDLGSLEWRPVSHGRRLWQIGRADRSSAEFKGGDNYRHYGNFLRYPGEFPDDVTFTIGQSREAEDWNFAHWSWFSRRPVWTIRFNLDDGLRGSAMLTVGLASVHPPRGRLTNLRVAVNGREVGVLCLPKSGSAGYRSGCQDSTYNVARLEFDAAILRQGRNEITLGHAEALPFSAPEAERRRAFGQVMYDAIRLEVAGDGPR